MQSGIWVECLQDTTLYTWNSQMQSFVCDLCMKQLPIPFLTSGKPLFWMTAKPWLQKCSLFHSKWKIGLLYGSLVIFLHLSLVSSCKCKALYQKNSPEVWTDFTLWISNHGLENSFWFLDLTSIFLEFKQTSSISWAKT